MDYKFTGLAKRLMELSYDNVEGRGETKYKSVFDFTPKRATEGSNGHDLFACSEEEIVIPPGKVAKVGSGVHVWIGSDQEIYFGSVKLSGFLMPRSSIKGCMLTNSVGLFDEDYQGEYVASLWNRTDEPITIKPGQSLVQLVFVLTAIPVLTRVEDFAESTSRGQGGFGSTGNIQ